MNLTNISEHFLTAIEFLQEINYNLLYEDILLCIKNVFEYLSDNFTNLIEFTDFQLFLLQIFLIVLLINLLLISICWCKYGGVITERFIKPSTLKEIEELKLSVAKLKLPNEHTPRI